MKIVFFRGIPCNNDLFIIYCLASNLNLLVQESDIFGAFLLRWLKDDKINYNVERKGFFKKKRIIFKFVDNIVINDELEKMMYNFLKNISRNNILDFNEFNEWLSNRTFDFNMFLNQIKMFSHDRMVKFGLLIPSNENVNQNIFPSNNFNKQSYRMIYNKDGVDSENDELGDVLSQSGNVKIVSSNSFILTSRYYEYVQQIVDFKKYIKEFSLIHEKELLDVKLWGDYLAISQLLGLADEVSIQLDKLVPGFKTKNISRKRVKIKIPGNVSKNEIENYIHDEINKRNDNIFKF